MSLVGSDVSGKLNIQRVSVASTMNVIGAV
jgi:hypothetical protein